MHRHPLVRQLEEIYRDAQESAVCELLKQAASMLTASTEQVTEQVDELSSLLRERLPGLDHEQSISVATDLIVQYGDDSGVTEGALPFGNHERKKGPDPQSSGMYQPGEVAWWENTLG